MVRRTAARQAKLWALRLKETQEAQGRQSDILVGAQGGNNWNLGIQIYPLNPSSAANNGIEIAQGVGEQNRQGNQIRLVKSSLKFSAYPENFTATNNTVKPLYLVLCIFRIKPGRASDDIANAIASSTDFYDNGNSVQGAQRDMFDLLQDINDDKYDVLRTYKWKLGRSDALTGAGASGSFSNNDFKLSIMRKMNLTKYCARNIKYIDVDPKPTCRHTWAAFYCVYADGLVMAQDQQPVRIRLFQDIQFKDI